MASSSSDRASASASASFRQPKHEVFLSFRGEDTRNNFLYHLYEAFQRKGIGAYADFKELPRGEEISHALLQTIEESRISIIVFSQNYATSSRCLDELSKIMECRQSRGQLVVPIFYHVSPSDIRNQTGSFGKAFVEHKRSKKDKVKRWKCALKEAGNLSGFTLKGDKPEPIVIEEIVRDVLNKLNRLSKRDYRGLIGIAPRMEQIKSLLGIGGDQDVRIIGIWGMGGIGKTTLAQVVYDEVSAQFESCYFLENVRERSTKPDDVIALRDKLLSNLLNQKNLHICTPLIGSTFIKDRLYRKRVLVVFDDVDDRKQLEKLGISRDYFGFGSRIIVTSRDKQVLKNGSTDEIYEVKELSYKASLQLFCLSAFKQNHPVGDFKDLSRSFLEYAGGVPIALKVLGSALQEKDIAYWESELHRLKQYPNKHIENVLKSSFEGLEDVDKNIFLDIACFFKGYDRDRVTKILDGCYCCSAHSGITNLIDKCLLNVTNENELGVHDLLQEMGRNVVIAECTDPEERSRLWTASDVCRVLKNGRRTKSIKGILLDLSEIDEVQLDPRAFARMHNLTIIVVYGMRGKLVAHRGLESLPYELRYLQWEHCTLKSLPSNFSPENLVELRLRGSNVEQLWNGKQNLVNLRVLDLTFCKSLTRIPELSAAINIEIVSVDGCRSLVELPSMIHLKKLSFPGVSWDIKYTDSKLNLYCCGNLKKFPELPQHITSVILDDTAIEEIPDSIDDLNQLKELALTRSRVKTVSRNIYKLESLERFTLGRCPIVLFPEVPRNLKRLCLFGNKIEEVPSSIGCLNQLTHLDMRGSQIRNLPSTIAQLDALEVIFLSYCPNITKFPNVAENIKRLFLDNTPIEEVPSSISRLKKLANLSMEDCRKLKSFPEILVSLENLNLNGCSNFEYFPEILEPMECLRYLDLSGTAIEEVHSSISELISLAHWSMEGCTKLKSLPKSICKLKSLKKLNLNGCSNLECFPEILQPMECLFCLHLRGTGIWNIVGLDNLVFLEELDLSGSDIVEIPECIKQHSKLKYLNLTCCKSLKSLPELPPRLKRLIAPGCTSLERVSKFCSEPGFSNLDFDRLWGIDENIFMLNNCFNLDRDAVNKIVASTLLRIQYVAEEFDVNGYQNRSVFSCFPGSEIPETFENRSTNSSITVQLSPACSSRRFFGFVLCIVVDFKHHQKGSLRVQYRFDLKSECGDHHNFRFKQTWRMEDIRSRRRWHGQGWKGIESNHVIILFDGFEPGLVEACRGSHFDEASFDFSIEGFDCEDYEWKQIEEVQKCGVNVLYVDAVGSNDEEVESSSNYWSAGEDLEVESSTNYWSDDEEEVDRTNKTKEPSCDANSSFIQDEENRCDASMSEPHSALGPNRLSLNCVINNRDLEGSMMEEVANDEEGLGDDTNSVKIISCPSL